MVADLQLGRLWRTVQPLRREQLLGRLTHELRHRAFRKVPPLMSWMLGRASAPEVGLKLIAHSHGEEERLAAAIAMSKTGRALLAGHEVAVRAWAAPALPKLVRYHLHYLDAARELAWAGALLQQPTMHEQARALIEDWTRENPVRGSEGWEPYAVAARLQNLVHVAGLWGAGTPEWLRSLMAVHARFLSAWPETHLQANHLLKDWVALALAGLLFQGPEADAWRVRALTRVRAELDEQLLPDGGHYERSPMYHLLVLADLLDIRELARARGLSLDWLENAVGRMARFAVGILHPDGEIPLFNDAVIGQAPSPASLLARLGAPVDAERHALFDAPHFGLSALRGQPDELLIFDSGALGPAHQPGHAHSDTLSYELSVGGVRCAVNSGVDGYQSPRRGYFRSAEAHNTVTVAGQGPDELWSAFRVGGRSTVLRRCVRHTGQLAIASAELRAFQGWQHQRTIALVPGRALVVLDEISRAPAGAALVSRARLLPAAPLRFQPLWGVELTAQAAPYAPRFGTPREIQEHAVSGAGPSARLGYVLLWGAKSVSAELNGATLHLTLDGQTLAVPRP